MSSTLVRYKLHLIMRLDLMSALELFLFLFLFLFLIAFIILPHCRHRQWRRVRRGNAKKKQKKKFINVSKMYDFGENGFEQARSFTYVFSTRNIYDSVWMRHFGIDLIIFFFFCFVCYTINSNRYRSVLAIYEGNAGLLESWMGILRGRQFTSPKNRKNCGLWSSAVRVPQI